MVQSPSWEANWFAATQEIPRISRNPKVHYRTLAHKSYLQFLFVPVNRPDYAMFSLEYSNWKQTVEWWHEILCCVGGVGVGVQRVQWPALCILCPRGGGGRRTLATICSVDVCDWPSHLGHVGCSENCRSCISTEHIWSSAICKELGAGTSNAETVMAHYEPTALFRCNSSTSIICVYTRHSTFLNEGITRCYNECIIKLIIYVSNYNLAGCFVWVWNLVADIEGGKEAEGVWEHGVEENIWT